MKRHTLANQAEFEAFAAYFARALEPGDVVALAGPLGAGKTAFVRSAVRALLGSDEATSPTFTFRHRYAAPPGGRALVVDHLDLFRIQDPREVFELGLEEAFSGDSIVFVEWWGQARDSIPARRYEIEIEGSGDGPRTVVVREPA